MLLGLTLQAVVAMPVTGRAGDRTCPPPHEIRVGEFSRDFVQTRHLEGLSAPIVSTGTVTLSGDRVVWHNLSPFDIRTTFGPEGVTQSVEGSEPQAINAYGNAGPLVGGLPLTDVLRGDLGKLETLFRVTTSSDAAGGHWTGILVPHDERLAEILGIIEVSGCTEVESITLRRPAGDYDVIRLSPSAGPAGDAAKASGNAR
jgi:hypothetical protein